MGVILINKISRLTHLSRTFNQQQTNLFRTRYGYMLVKFKSFMLYNQIAWGVCFSVRRQSVQYELRTGI